MNALKIKLRCNQHNQFDEGSNDKVALQFVSHTREGVQYDTLVGGSLNLNLLEEVGKQFPKGSVVMVTVEVVPEEQQKA